ncbi:MAG TPA: hypothetical protein VGQ95_10240 [Chthoniobacterales bacterium]|nr:hypothetical protein [Chthoniobacterales bacterium]
MRLSFLALVFACLTNAAQNGVAAERSVSPSRQFVIYGADTSVRGAISELAEQTKTNLLALLRRTDDWKTPIIISLQWPQANLPEIPPAALHFSQTGSGLKLQLDLIVGRELDRAAVERELLRTILLEMIYRNETGIAAGEAYVAPPDWLIDGILALTPGRDRTPLIEALSLAEKNVSLKEFFRQRPELLDSPARFVYRAYSFALVRLLVDEADGRAHLSRYIGNLSRASTDSPADLTAQFPELTGDDGEKIWKATIAALRVAQNSELLTFAETERKLDQLLRGKSSEPPKLGETLQLENFLRVKPSRAQEAALKKVSQDLLLLAARANPVMRPLVQEYQQIAAQLVAGKHQKLAERLARVEATRARMSARMSQIDDYMNWCEATKLKTPSGEFADYLRAAGSARELKPRRQDALSVYLDALEEQF